MQELDYIQELNQEVKSLYEYIDDVYTHGEDFNDRFYDANFDSPKYQVKSALPCLFAISSLGLLNDVIYSEKSKKKNFSYSNEIFLALENTAIIVKLSDSYGSVLSKDISFEYNGKIVKLKRGETISSQYNDIDIDVSVFIGNREWDLIGFCENIDLISLSLSKDLLLIVDRITQLCKLSGFPMNKILNIVLDLNEFIEEYTYDLYLKENSSKGLFDQAYERISKRADNSLGRLLRLLVSENEPKSVLSLYSDSQIVDELICDSKCTVYGHFTNYSDFELFDIKKILYNPSSFVRSISCVIGFGDPFIDFTNSTFLSSSSHISDRISFQNLVAFPPFNLRLADQDTLSNRGGKKVNFYHTDLLYEIVDEIGEGAKAVVVVPASFLTSSRPDEKEVRERLIKYNLLDYVIQFKSSEKLLGSHLGKTSIDFVVLGISNDSKKPNKVKLVKGDVYESNGDFTAIESIYADVINDKVSIVTDRVRSVSFETIEDEDFNLSLNRYFINKAVGVPLSDILTEMKLPSAKETDLLGDLINVKDLKSDPFDFNVDSFSKLQGNKKLIRKLPSEALLVSKIFSPFKVSYVKLTENRDIYVSQNLRSFEVNLDVVNLDYLMYVLNTTFFEDQIRRVAQGSAMKTFSIKDFLNICIDLPSISQQKSLVLDAKKLKIKGDRAEFDLLEAKLLGSEKLHSQDSAQFKHSMAQFLSGVNSGVKVLRNHLASIDGLVLDVNELFGKNNERSIDTLMNQLLMKVEDCNNMLLGLETDTTLVASEEVVYTDLIDQLRMSILADSFKVVLENNIAESDFSDDFSDDFARDPITINVSVNLFKKMFHNIVDNAIKHGFIGNEKQHLLKIKSSISSNLEDKASIILEISNNGQPFPKDYDKKQFITKWSKSGATANSGLGGSAINSIVNSFNGTFDLELDAKAEFPVRYVINIPIEL